MQDDVKLINTDDLMLASAASAKKFGKIRALSLDTKKYTLDPEGIHFIGFTLAQELNVRCEILCKVVGSVEPHRAWLDMEYDTFNKLKTWGEVKQHVSPQPA